jgi:hypothetical protein
MFVITAYAVATRPSELDQSETAFRHGDFKTATEFVHSMLKGNPNNLAALKLKAKIAIEMERFKEATEVLKPFMESMSDTEIKGLYALACVSFKEERTTGIQCYLDFYNSGPRTKVNLNNLAWALIEDGRYEEAAFYFEEPVLRDSDDPIVLFNFAHIEHQRAQSTLGYNPIRGLDAAIKAANVMKETGVDPPAEFSFFSARLRKYVSKFAPLVEEDLFADLRQAILNGMKNATILNDAFFAPYRTNRRFAELADVKAVRKNVPMRRLIRPYEMELPSPAEKSK